MYFAIVTALHAACLSGHYDPENRIVNYFYVALRGLII